MLNIKEFDKRLLAYVKLCKTLKSGMQNLSNMSISFSFIASGMNFGKVLILQRKEFSFCTYRFFILHKLILSPNVFKMFIKASIEHKAYHVFKIKSQCMHNGSMYKTPHREIVAGEADSTSYHHLPNLLITIIAFQSIDIDIFNLSLKDQVCFRRQSNDLS
jgi:hypothetical protein